MNTKSLGDDSNQSSPSVAASEPPKSRSQVTLKTLARHLELSPSTISIVLNQRPIARGIPRTTQERIFRAARDLGYRPNLLARSLRNQRTQSIGVLVPEIDSTYVTGVVAGLESPMLARGYHCLVGSHHSDRGVSQDQLDRLRQQRVEGLVVVATSLLESPGLPTVSVAGRRLLDGVTNVVIDHDHAAVLALEHLKTLGHRRIAFLRGPATNEDAQDRWRAIQHHSVRLGLAIDPALVRKLSGTATESPHRHVDGYREGARMARDLLERGPVFTALFAFNDLTAIGAIRALQESGLRIPDDVSVVGFDDLHHAAFQNPSLTTVRQPLDSMGETAGEVLLGRLRGEAGWPSQVTIEPTLQVRESTGPARSLAA